MSWSRALYETYENCKGAVGIDKEHPSAVPLPPLYHDLKKIGYEIFIDKNGNFRTGTARKIDEMCIAPTSEASEGRVGSTPTPAPLFDDLKYMAGDYAYHVGDEKQRSYFDEYIKQLQQWCESDHCLPEIMTICAYLGKKTLINDLLSSGAVPLDKDGNIIKKELDASVRIGIRRGLDDPFYPWESTEAWECHIAYTRSKLRDTGLCYISGCEEQLALSHPKIGGNAKLISSNQDNKGFIVNAGFLAGAENAVSVGYESSQKIHLSLKWLIRRQGFPVGDQVWLAFGTNEPSVTSMNTDTYGIYTGFDPAAVAPDTQDIFADKLRKAVRGYRQDFKGYGKVVIIGVNAVTPGRLSIIYYQESDENYYLEKVVNWHSTCTWLHNYKTVFKDGSKKPEWITFYGAPALLDIVKAAYGEKVPDKLKMSAYARLVPCVTEGADFPKDIMTQVARRAGSPEGMEDWEYRKTQSIACAVIRKYYNDRKGREVYRMALDKECNERSYLYGRWLAYAHNVERFAQRESGSDMRMTNAERHMHQFSLRPKKTLEIISNQLNYYFKKIYSRPSAHIMQNEMNALLDRIGIEGFNDKALSEVYLIGYASQLLDIKKTIKEINEKDGK